MSKTLHELVDDVVAFRTEDYFVAEASAARRLAEAAEERAMIAEALLHEREVRNRNGEAS